MTIEELLKDVKVEWKKLGEVCVIGTGSSNRQDEDIQGLYPFYVRSKNVLKSNTYQFDETAIVIPGEGGIGEIYHFVEGKYALHQRAYRIKVKQFGVITKFLYYYLANHFKTYILMKSVGSTVTSIRKPMLENFLIPIPPISVQEKIVETLDKFTDYVTELQIELQIELQARHRQYNYYRDLLLSEDYLNRLSETLDDFTKKVWELREVTLGEIGTFIRGNGLQKSDFVSNGKPVIHYGQLYTKFIFETDKVISYVREEIFSKLRKANPQDILIATTSENIKDVGKAVVWTGNEEIGISGDMHIFSTKENPKYIAYYFQTLDFQKQKERKVSGTKLIRIHAEDMEKFKIFLPPLFIQNKVVEILDKFQALIKDTDGLLPEEIEQRQKQYEFYREKLLTFDQECSTTQHNTTQHNTTQHNHNTTLIITSAYFVILKQAATIVGVKLFGVEWKKLGEVAQCYDGTHQTPVYTEQGVPFVSVENIDNLYQTKKYISEEDFSAFKIKPQKDDLFMTRIGTIGSCAVVKENSPLAFYVTLALIKTDKTLISSKFLQYFIESCWGKKELSKRILHHATPIKINLGDISKIKIPLPSLAVQEHIVSVLDRFDTLVNYLDQGLPKAIEQSQKQYEYYREKLLSFEKP